MLYSSVLTILWRSVGNAMAMLWRLYGDLMAMWWRYYDDVLAMLWRCYDDVLAMLRRCFDYGLAMFWRCHGDVTAILCRCFDDVLVMFWRYCFGNVLAMCCVGHVVTASGVFLLLSEWIVSFLWLSPRFLKHPDTIPLVPLSDEWNSSRFDQQKKGL